MAKTLKEIVVEKSVISGDCLLWQSTMTKWGRPVTNVVDEFGGKKTVDLQLYLARKKFNLPENTKVKIVTTCGNPNCITSSHIQLGKIERVKSGRKKRGTKVASIKHNKAVFDLLVTTPPARIGGTVGLSYKTVKAIIKNKAMLPYFQLRLQWHIGEDTLDKIRQSHLPDNELALQHRISRYAVDFIRSEQNYPIADETLYLSMLAECEVLGDHLVWAGEIVRGSPMVRTFGNRLKSVTKMFKYAVTGVLPPVSPCCSCKVEGCVNPFHLE